MMRNCINRSSPGRPAVTPSRRHDYGQGSPPAADGRPSAPGPCPPWRRPCQPHRRTAMPDRLPAPGPYPMAVLPVNGRAGAVSAPPSPEPAPSTAPVPALPSAHDASRA